MMFSHTFEGIHNDVPSIDLQDPGTGGSCACDESYAE